MKTIVVIPTYNEKENIIPLGERIFALKISDLEILFVDDHSPDGTADEIKKLSAQYPVHILERAGKFGLGSAYRDGFARALALGADLVFEMDADFSHDPADIARMVAACEQGADLAIGSRKVAGGAVVGWNLWRKIMSEGARYFTKLILGLKTQDVTAGFRCYRRAVLENINWDQIKSRGYAFQEEILYFVERAGFKVVEVPVIFNDRAHGLSKMSKRDIWEFFVIILRLRFGKN